MRGENMDYNDSKKQNKFDVGWTIFALLAIFGLGIYCFFKYQDEICLLISVLAGSTCGVWVKSIYARLNE
jgi:hypothetical protein